MIFFLNDDLKNSLFGKLVVGRNFQRKPFFNFMAHYAYMEQHVKKCHLHSQMWCGY